MHSIYARINNLTASLSTCLLVLLGAISLSSFLLTAEAPGDLVVSSIKVFPGASRRLPNIRQEFAFVHFNISADLTPLFHWNTKQLFLYLQAEYEDKHGVSGPYAKTHPCTLSAITCVRIATLSPLRFIAFVVRNLASLPSRCIMSTVYMAWTRTDFRVDPWSSLHVTLTLLPRFPPSSSIYKLPFTLVQNDVVIWDRVVRRSQDAVVNVAGRNKYVFRDPSHSFQEASPANYSLKYNLMPYVGVLTYGEIGRTQAPVAFPEPEEAVS